MPEAAHMEAPPARACHRCGARQDERQEICVECGAVVPRARIARLRALKPAALAGFAVLVVTSAAYGVSVNAERDSSAVKQAVAAAPQPPPPPPAAAPPETPPAPTTPPADSSPADSSPAPADPAPVPDPAAAPAPKAPARPAPSTPSPTVGGRGSGRGNRGHDSGGTTTTTHARPAWLSEGDQPYSATLYDPYSNGADEHAAAAPKAVDGSARTAWVSADHTGGLGKPGVGIAVEASGYQGYSALGIQTKTPGFAVSVYSTDAGDPPQAGPDEAGSGWKLEGSKTSVARRQRIVLKGATANPHYVLVWITKLPPGQQRVGLSEISLLP